MGQRRKAMNRRRGLRIVLWVVSLFWLAQVAGGVVLDYVWVRPRYPVRADMIARLKARQQPPEILFLGSSRFGCNINCDVVDAELRRDLGDHAPRCFNASLPAGDPTVFERILDDLSHEGYKPKLVVLEIDPGAVNRRDNWLYQHALNMLDWRDVPEAAPALCRNGRIMYLVRGRLLPLYLHRYHLRKDAVARACSLFHHVPSSSTTDPPVPGPVETDPEPPAKTPDVQAAMEQGYAIVTNEVKNYRVGGMASHRLERLLEHWRQVGVPVLLVGVPVSSPSRRACTTEVNTAFLAYIHSLCDRYGCSYADCRDQVPDKYFFDNHHVFPEGGVYFSRRLAMSVLSPHWLKR